MAVYQRFIAELDQNNQHLSHQVSEIDLSDPEDLRATMPEQGSDILAHFGEDHFMQRLQVYKANIAKWRSVYPKLIGVDLRYEANVPLEMATDVAGGEASPAKLAPMKASPVKASPAGASAVASRPKGLTNDTNSAKAAPMKAASVKTSAAQKAAEARKRAARLKAAKAKAAHDKALHGATHATSTVKQGQ